MEDEISLSPFDMIGSWDEETLANVSVSFTQLRKSAFHNISENYPITFTSGYYNSNTIRINDVSISYSSESGYGCNYICICLPDMFEKLIKTRVKKQFSNIIGSKYHGEPGKWWKSAFIEKGAFKVTDKNQICTPVSVEEILKHTKKGVLANLRLEFSITHRNVAQEDVLSVEIRSGFITSIGVEIKPPTPLGVIPGRPMPQDIASDDIIEKLEELKSIPS